MTWATFEIDKLEDRAIDLRFPASAALIAHLMRQYQGREKHPPICFADLNAARALVVGNPHGNVGWLHRLRYRDDGYWRKVGD